MLRRDSSIRYSLACLICLEKEEARELMGWGSAEPGGLWSGHGYKNSACWESARAAVTMERWGKVAGCGWSTPTVG